MGILICGLNGAGKTTLGKELARRLGWRFLDSEALFFESRLSREEAVRALEELVSADRNFVFASVTGDYGDTVLSCIDLIAVLQVPREERLRRVKERSRARYGARMAPGGDLYERERPFFEMVAARDEGHVTRWLERVRCPIVYIDGTLPTESEIDIVLKNIK